MGGSALKNIETKRLDTKEFEELKNELISKLEYEFMTNLYPLKYYYEKQDHGDLDILIKIPFINDNRIESILYDKFLCNEVVHNGGCYSFDYKEFQIDLILTEEKYWEIAKIFYDFNDWGIFAGRIANSIGLKFGYEGLKYVLYSEDKSEKLKKIHLTSNIKKIFYILGLDYEKYLKGFKNLDEMFTYFAYSKRFYKKLGTLGFLNSDQRHRDKKRKNIKAFEKWLENKNDIPDNNEKYSFEKTIDLIDKEFPEIKIKTIVEKEYKKLEIKKKISEKFNGTIVMKIFPNLSGEALGKSLNKFKYILDNDYSNFILNNDLETILNKFKEINGLP